MVLLDELADVRFLHGLAPVYLKSIARVAQLKEYPTDTILFHEGQDTSWVYLVLQGAVALEIDVSGHGSVQVQTLAAGELLGWSPVLGLGPMTATARTLSRCRLAALDAGRLAALCRQDPCFGVEFLRRTGAALAQRLGSTRRQMAGLYPPELHLVPGGSLESSGIPAM